MKLQQELSLLSKYLSIGIIPTPLSIWEDKYIRIGWTVYSNKLIESDLSFALVEAAYNKIEVKQDTTELVKLIKSVIDWRIIDLEDINTYDALGWIAWIEWTDYWINTSDLTKIIKMIWINPYQIKVNNQWIIAFTNLDKIYILFTLTPIQRSLLD